MSGDRAIVLGGSGAVGSALIHELLESQRWNDVTSLTRRPIAGAASARLAERVIDMSAILAATKDAARGCRSAFCTLGAGQPSKLTHEEHWRIDVEYAAAFARGAHAAGVEHFTLLTSVGANATSRFWYARVKGAIEEQVIATGIPRVSFFRPSLLLTHEVRYGMQDRITRVVFPLLSPLLPRRFHEIRVEDVARAMRINAERDSPPGVEIVDYPAMRRLLTS